MFSTNLVHQFPALLHRLFVHGTGLVMGVEMMVVRLEGILHHADEPPTFLQVPCHVSRLASTRAMQGLGKARNGGQGARGSGYGGSNRLLLAGPGDRDPAPLARKSPEWRIGARVRGRDRGRNDYRMNTPIIEVSVTVLPDKCTYCG